MNHTINCNNRSCMFSNTMGHSNTMLREEYNPKRNNPEGSTEATLVNKRMKLQGCRVVNHYPVGRRCIVDPCAA